MAGPEGKSAAAAAARFAAAGVEDPRLREKYRRLRDILAGCGSAVVGYSGGTDSALLAAATQDVLGGRSLACLAVSPSLAKREYAAALATAAALGLNLEVYAGTEFDNPAYLANDVRRCYYCKSDLFLHLRRFAKERGFSQVLYGGNVDDLADYRPGHDAAHEHGALAPLAEAGLTKAEIRRLSAIFGLPTSNKAASPCLSSRLPYGSEVTRDRLAAVEAGEELLAELGFHDFRVRHEGDIARVEVPLSDIGRFADATATERLVRVLKARGFRKVLLDLEGFRSGNLNPPTPPARSA